jgi:hypothetical protein
MRYPKGTIPFLWSASGYVLQPHDELLVTDGANSLYIVIEYGKTG